MPARGDKLTVNAPAKTRPVRPFCQNQARKIRLYAVDILISMDSTMITAHNHNNDQQLGMFSMGAFQMGLSRCSFPGTAVKKPKKTDETIQAEPTKIAFSAELIWPARAMTTHWRCSGMAPNIDIGDGNQNGGSNHYEQEAHMAQ